MLRWLQSLIWRHSPVLLHLPHIRQLQSELPKEIGTRPPGFLQKHGNVRDVTGFICYIPMLCHPRSV